jgi:hypothetical protein
MGDRTERPTLNMSAIPVAGVGGLGLLGLVVIVAIAFPAARLLLLCGVVGGALVALALVLARRHRRIGSPRNDLPISLLSEGTEIVDQAPAAERETKATWSQERCLATK